jgi:hypothetical protein
VCVCTRDVPVALVCIHARMLIVNSLIRQLGACLFATISGLLVSARQGEIRRESHPPRVTGSKTVRSIDVILH